MAGNGKPSKVEIIKENSRQLLGTLPEELNSDEDHFSGDAVQLLKHHGSYQQDDRDNRGGGGKDYMFMVRTRIPGGRVTAQQMLAELDLCDRVANGTLRVTTRQGLQLHGVVKRDMRETIRTINASKLTTLAACGDVSRNTMCCPAPYKNDHVRDEMQSMAGRIAELLRPKTTAYYEIWLRDHEGESVKVDEYKPVEEPIYGKHYLPRKFKVGVGLPEDNCIDIYTQDLGFLTVVEDGRIVGYNVLVGGGMGMTPAKKDTYPAMAKRMAFATPEQVLGVTEAVVKVQRDFGDRSDRRQARLKYLLANWGLEQFKAKVEEYYGQSLPEPHPADVTDASDHAGWHEQGDGRWFLGINIENGRIKDEGDLRLKTGLRTLFERFSLDGRLTALQDLILCDIEPSQRSEIDRVLADHGVKSADQLTPMFRYSMACPALPTCGLAIAESERIMPDLLRSIEETAAAHGLANERISIHMTGCPNGCARPYTPDIGLVGKARGKYTVYLGGNTEGTRLAFLYDDMVPEEEIAPRLSPLFRYFADERQNGESFGDFCHRVGKEQLTAATEQTVAT